MFTIVTKAKYGIEQTTVDNLYDAVLVYDAAYQDKNVLEGELINERDQELVECFFEDRPSV